MPGVVWEVTLVRKRRPPILDRVVKAMGDNDDVEVLEVTFHAQAFDVLIERGPLEDQRLRRQLVHVLVPVDGLVVTKMQPRLVLDARVVLVRVQQEVSDGEREAPGQRVSHDRHAQPPQKLTALRGQPYAPVAGYPHVVVPLGVERDARFARVGLLSLSHLLWRSRLLRRRLYRHQCRHRSRCRSRSRSPPCRWRWRQQRLSCRRRWRCKPRCELPRRRRRPQPQLVEGRREQTPANRQYID
mmetsp:Transcript_49816/g.139432  ORF Transcript_49816/g.139432 Transcript_49816/m.139432 type:complete len:242 (+) Transcript_49816:584-1309(+)